MPNVIPRVAAVHDISGFGRCSLTVIIPVLSAMGVQVCPLPTAVLSTHSGGFGQFSFHDLTSSLEGHIKHWEDLQLSFDCIYSGFLGSSLQIDIVSRLFHALQARGRTLVVVDPVMGDDGRLYRTYTPEMQQQMRKLVRQADLITPNLTEACFLLDEAYDDQPMSICHMQDTLSRLSELGPKTVVITGVQAEDGSFANIALDQQQNRFWRVNYQRVLANYPGTGDIFTSVLVGSLLRGESLPMAMDLATQFLSLAVRVTRGHQTPAREGVMLERVLPWLGSQLMESRYEVLG